MRCKPIEGPRPYSSIYYSARSARISSTHDFRSLCFAKARLPRPWTLQLCPMCRSSNLNQRRRQECHNMLHCFIGILAWKLPHWSHVESIPIDPAKTRPSCFSIRTALLNGRRCSDCFQNNHSILCSHTCNIIQWHFNSENKSTRTQSIEAVWAFGAQQKAYVQMQISAVNHRQKSAFRFTFREPGWKTCRTTCVRHVCQVMKSWSHLFTTCTLW